MTSALLSRSLVGVPFEGGSPYAGPRQAFKAIEPYLRSKLPQVSSLFDEVIDLDEDAWSFLDRSRLRMRLPELVSRDRRLVVSVGGCHSISYYAINALRRRYPD